MASREEALERFYEWEREEVEYHYYALPKFIKRIILNNRMKTVKRKYDNGQLNTYIY